MAQQTAVDFLVTVLIPSSTLQIKTINDFIAQAKQMEMSQLEDAYYTDCIKRPTGVLTPLMPIFIPFDKYFEEKYK